MVTAGGQVLAAPLRLLVEIVEGSEAFSATLRSRADQREPWRALTAALDGTIENSRSVTWRWLSTVGGGVLPDPEVEGEPEPLGGGVLPDALVPPPDVCGVGA